MIERLYIYGELYRSLQTGYVALLGQRGSGMKTLLQRLTERSSSAMTYMHVALPLGVDRVEDFENAFLDYLIEAANRTPSTAKLVRKMIRVRQFHSKMSANYQLRQVLRVLGGETNVQYIVIVLRLLTKVSQAPLKNLLLMLREYYDQRNIPGEVGYKLRVVVMGDSDLWELCYHPNQGVSPFNIAHRLFLSGLTVEEVQKSNPHTDTKSITNIVTLTNGIPSFIENALRINSPVIDYEPYYIHVLKYWNDLPASIQEAFRRIVVGTEVLPLCNLDPTCNQIPILDPFWLPAFWSGFLRMQEHQLIWRSPIHKSFVQIQTKNHITLPAISELVKPRIFISHSHADNAFCRLFVNAIKEHDFDIWYDEHDNEPGLLDSIIEKEITSRPYFIVILSPSALLSPWVQAEISAAKALLYQQQLRMFLPVVAESCQIPFLLENYTRIEGPNGNPVSIEEAAARTLRMIGKKV